MGSEKKPGVQEPDDRLIRAFSLLRISSREQSEGAGLDAQERKINEALDGLNGETSIEDRIVEDGISGTKFPRASLLKILDAARKDEFDVLVTKDVSRIGRLAAPTFAFIWLLNYWFNIDLVVEDGRYNINQKADLIQIFFRAANAELKNRFRTSYVIDSQLEDFRQGNFHVTGRSVRFGYKSITEGDSDNSDQKGRIEEGEDLAVHTKEESVVKAMFEELTNIGAKRDAFKRVRSKVEDQFGEGRVPDESIQLRNLLRNPIYKGRPTWEVNMSTDEKQTVVMERDDLKIVNEALFEEVQGILDDRYSRHWDHTQSEDDSTPERLTLQQITSIVGLSRLLTFKHVVRIHCPDCGEEMVDNGRWRATSDLKPSNIEEIPDDPILKRYRCTNKKCERSEKRFPNEFESYMVFSSDVSLSELIEQN